MIGKTCAGVIEYADWQDQQDWEADADTLAWGIERENELREEHTKKWNQHMYDLAERQFQLKRRARKARELQARLAQEHEDDLWYRGLLRGGG